MSKLVTGIAVFALCTGVAAPAATAAPVGVIRSGNTHPATQHLSLAERVARTSFSPALKAKLSTLIAKLPAGKSALTSRLGAADPVASDWRQIRDSAIDGSQYQCADTALSAFVDSSIDSLSDDDFVSLLIMNMYGGLDVPTYDALVFGHESRSNTFGLDGSYGNRLNHEMRTLKSFWDIRSSDIELMPMHGAQSFENVGHVAQVLTWMGYSQGDATYLAGVFDELLAKSPGLQGGDHPLFTFNAFAYSNYDDPDPAAAGITDRIIVGDGILTGMKAIGLDKNAPEGILAHEFGHHVQYEDNLFVSPLSGPEATRRTELMADAFGTYFLVHKKGESNNRHDVLKDAQSFYEVGDCSFADNGHHGTPNQRIKASTWGADMAAAAKPASYVMPSLQLDAKFEQQLPVIVAPDAR